MKLSLLIFVTCIVMIAVHPHAEAEQIPRDVVGSGGGESSSTNYQLLHTVGQAVIGVVSNAESSDEQGFWYSPWSFVTGVEDDPLTPKVYRLEQNFPNPFNPVTTIQFTIVEPSHVRLQVYDVSGRLVMTVIDREMDAGGHTVRLKAKDLASGVYFYRLIADRFVKTRKMIVLR